MKILQRVIWDKSCFQTSWPDKYFLGVQNERNECHRKILSGRRHSSEGRTVVEVISFDNGELEINNNYVQWLFPLVIKVHLTVLHQS
jgi:hypothetical protein